MTTALAPRLRVAIVDDDTVIRDGLPLLLHDSDIVGRYSDIDELLLDTPTVGVVLLDLVLTGTGRSGIRQGASGIRAVKDAGYRVLIYTNERRRAVLASCLAIGARGVVHKAEPIRALETAIAAVANDQPDHVAERCRSPPPGQAHFGHTGVGRLLVRSDRRRASFRQSGVVRFRSPAAG